MEILIKLDTLKHNVVMKHWKYGDGSAADNDPLSKLSLKPMFQFYLQQPKNTASLNSKRRTLNAALHQIAETCILNPKHYTLNAGHVFMRCGTP